MAGIIKNIQETLHLGGSKEGEHKKAEQSHDVKGHGGVAPVVHKPEGEHKEGFMEKIKDKIHGGEGTTETGEKKKKEKKKKKHEDGRDHGDSSSSSDSD
ncbi:dehydrin HIRD11 [Mercurialis annua]|uniref:dehydrin HIRD11 n=1 Tax=Mercurialis annua TaxID=3986 RepID=UPI0021610B5A|nr:dehydrin HIRD11 [Mercurialis annua]XP_050235490.1 dehydrin HIRD11 [Mercurialis annua]